MAETVQDAIDEFYKLKNKYESDFYKKKKEIISDNELSSKEKKSQFKKLKPKCINCKRPGGTLFSVKLFSEPEEYRQLRAICGVIADPCNLDINIHVGKYEFLPTVLDDIEKEIQDKKKTIITDKNRLLFGFITSETAVENFEQIKDYINNFTSLLDTYLTEYNSITDNQEKKNELKDSIVKSYFYIEEIKKSVQKFNEENNKQYINDAVNIYINSLKPILTKIMELKYKESIVYFNENDNTYNLIQQKTTQQSLEFTYFDNKVVNFDVGLKLTIPSKPASPENSLNSEANIKININTPQSIQNSPI